MKLPLQSGSLAEIRGKQMAEYRDARLTAENHSSTYRNELTIISQVYATAQRVGMYELRNPVDNVKRPKQTHERRPNTTVKRKPHELAHPAYIYADIYYIRTAARRRKELRRSAMADLTQANERLFNSTSKWRRPAVIHHQASNLERQRQPARYVVFARPTCSTRLSRSDPTSGHSQFALT